MCSELAREKMWSRIHLIPLLQAEEDRDQVRRYYAQQAMEKDLLGAETKVYHNDRCVPYAVELYWKEGLTGYIRFVRPTYAVTPANITK